MICDVTALLASIFLLCWACATRPTHARCPPDWWINGVRPSGELGCRPADGRDIEIHSRIYCTGGSVPIVVDDRTVGCTR
jgi:hypothetical protein